MRYLICILLGLSLSACDNNDSGNSGYHGVNVELSEVSDEQCFNVQKYFQILRSMPPSTPVRYMTTDFDAKAMKNNFIATNFKLRTGYQSFFIEDTTMNRVNEIRPLVQPDCETVTYMLNGIEQKYKITAKGPNYITLEDDFEERLTYKWESKNTMHITHEFLQGDLNCNEKAKATLIVNRELTWGDARVVRAPTIPQGKISDRYLTLLSQATNYPKNNLYVGPDERGPVATPFPRAFVTEVPAPNPPENPTHPEPTPVEEEPSPVPEPTEPPVAEPSPVPSEPPGEFDNISIAKVREMLEQPLRPELLRCN